MTPWYHFYKEMEPQHDENAYFARWQQKQYKWSQLTHIHTRENVPVEMESVNVSVWRI